MVRRSRWPLKGDETLSAPTPDGSIKEQSSASEDICLSQAVTDARHSTSKSAASLTPSPRRTPPKSHRHSRKTGPQDLSTMRRDRRCALYQGEPRRTLCARHDRYIRRCTCWSLFPKVSPGDLPFDSNAHVCCVVLLNREWGDPFPGLSQQ